jgi:hypothetical protein
MKDMNWPKMNTVKPPHPQSIACGEMQLRGGCHGMMFQTDQGFQSD